MTDTVSELFNSKSLVGNRKYVQVLGDPLMNDTFTAMGSFGPNLYVMFTTEQDPASIMDRRFNIQLYEIRMDSGIINRRLRMGSLGFRDQTYDMKVTHKGIYVMARIGSYFCIEGTCSNQ